MSDENDYRWLVGDNARVWLELGADGPGFEKRLRKAVGAGRARLVAEQVALRERAVEKFGTLAAAMFFTPVGLQQATDQWIARYKAARLASGSPVVDLCCGIGGDLLALAERGPSVGVDRSREIAVLAEANLRTVETVAGCGVAVANAESFALESGTLWHIDPDRRTDGQRSTRVVLHSPGPEVVERLRGQSPDGAVKLAPAAELPPGWAEEAEMEWLTRGRECRQLVAWFGSLATDCGRRRATLIPSSEGQGGGAVSFVGEPRPGEPATEPGPWLADPDASLIAAGLVGAFASEHGLRTLGVGGVYLTGDRPCRHPLVSEFEVEAVLPLREKAVGGYLRERSVGTVELKQRGVGVDLESFRRALKLAGSDSRTVVLTRVGEKRMAIVARRVPSEGGSG